MTRRQQMMLAWSLIALGNGFFYLPFRSGYGDFPAALTKVVPVGDVWIFGVLWMFVWLFGTASIWRGYWERWFWPALLLMMFGWGGLYLAGALTGTSPASWKGGSLYLAVAYGMWASRGEPDDDERRGGGL